MKRKMKKMLAVFMVSCMSLTFAVPAYASEDLFTAPEIEDETVNSGESKLSDFLDGIFHSKKPSKPSKPNKPSKPSKPSNGSGKGSLKVIENETTVVEGTELRANTYALAAPAAQADSTELKYFPVTLYNYDKTIFNNATHQLEVDQALANGGIDTLTQWNGVYFGNGKNPENYTYSTGGTYSEVRVEYNWRRDYSQYTDGSYYVNKDKGYYKVISLECTRSWNRYTWTILYEGGSEEKQGSIITLYKNSNTATTNELPFGYHNWWTGDLNISTSTGGNNGNQTYSGIVKNRLDANKNIQFNYPQAGIFTEDNSNKEVYTNVGLPFVYNADNGYYTFDANEDGAYFHTDAVQETSSEPASNSRLYFNGTPQSHDFPGQDGRSKGWFPYDDTTNVMSANADYYFGMNGTFPFTMTTNGCMNANDDNSEPIKFEFSGDDDVWVFIDGILVLDIGGERNCLDGTIDFADNTFNITKTDRNGGGALGDAATANDSNLSGKLFNDENGEGVLGVTRETFAATDEHNLTIFYLERGGGSSNCKIKFNLPFKDNVTVQKLITQSKTDKGETTSLTASEQKMVEGVDFGFTLYKDDAPVANTTYIRTNKNGQMIDTPSTDSNGHFTLKNGEMAKFVGVIDETDGNTYYVVEDEKDGYSIPDYNCDVKVAGGYTEKPRVDRTSMKISAIGGEEAQDYISFVCTNYLRANLPNPYLNPEDDEIVIDYGLPVEIPDVLANDTWKGETIELLSVSDGTYGQVTKSGGKYIYTLTEQLSGVDILTYRAKVTGTGNSGDQTTADSMEKDGKIYIIPATTMYYEEDFGNMVKCSNNWSSTGTAMGIKQETGLVGTVGDSPYGTDAAYLNNTGDSNGTSKHVSTTATEGASFSYEFTGTGTSFFARTTNKSGQMKVTIKKDGTIVYTGFRDTSYKTEDNNTVLYNIPVFTWNADSYGTYTVNVAIAKAINEKYGSEFWLDGIRVYKPLSNLDVECARAQAAYANDGEANCKIVTLREKLLKDCTDSAALTVADVDNPEFVSDAAITSGETGSESEDVPSLDDSFVDVAEFSSETEIQAESDLSTVSDLVWSEQDQKEGNFVLFTDTNGAMVDAGEYISNGPKEEVYLNNGQSVSFGLTNWNPNSMRLYLGIKAPMGNGEVDINGHRISINNTVDCYYDISSYGEKAEGSSIYNFKIKAIDAVISVTTIKATGSTEFSIIDPKAESVALNDEIESEDTDVQAAFTSPDMVEDTMQMNPENNDVTGADIDVFQDAALTPEEADVFIEGEE